MMMVKSGFASNQDLGRVKANFFAVDFYRRTTGQQSVARNYDVFRIDGICAGLDR